LHKSNQICPNLTNFAQKNFARACAPAPTTLSLAATAQ